MSAQCVVPPPNRDLVTERLAAQPIVPTPSGTTNAEVLVSALGKTGPDVVTVGSLLLSGVTS